MEACNQRPTVAVCRWVVLALLVLACAAGCRAPAPVVKTDQEYLQSALQGVVYQQESRGLPRPLVLHHVTVDLQHAGLEVVACVAPPPPNAGPAQAELTLPMKLATDQELLVAVNANAFSPIPDAQGKTSDHWVEKQPVNLLGLAVAAGVVRHEQQAGYGNFWLDQSGKAHIGTPINPADVRTGVAGFEVLMQDGEVLSRQGGPLHPRTAVGLDASGRYLHLVVVDGRQAGYSEGMSSEELGHYLQQLGCHSALNLDGGGSSILLLGQAPGKLAVMNRPSTIVLGAHLPRPVPVMLGVRLAPKAEPAVAPGSVGVPTAPLGR